MFLFGIPNRRGIFMPYLRRRSKSLFFTQRLIKLPQYLHSSIYRGMLEKPSLN